MKPNQSQPLRYVTIVVQNPGWDWHCIVFSGLNGFLNFVKPPPNARCAPGRTSDSVGRIHEERATKCLYHFRRLQEQRSAEFWLLTNSTLQVAARALAILAPGHRQYSWRFHLFLAPSGIGMAVFVVLVELYLAWAYRSSFRAMLVFHAKHGC